MQWPVIERAPALCRSLNCFWFLPAFVQFPGQKVGSTQGKRAVCTKMDHWVATPKPSDCPF